MGVMDLFICPGCNATTPIEGAPPGYRIVAREIRCKCGRRYAVIVNEGCRVQDYRSLKASK